MGKSLSTPQQQEDTLALRRRISQLENENKQLREKEKEALPSTFAMSASIGGREKKVTNEDRNWMSSIQAPSRGPAAPGGLG